MTNSNFKGLQKMAGASRTKKKSRKYSLVLISLLLKARKIIRAISDFNYYRITNNNS